MKNRPRGNHPGKHCYVERMKDGRLLKIFDAYPNIRRLEDMNWGDKGQEVRRWVNLKDATIFQNYCWWHGLAPRVYEVKRIQRNRTKYWAQITDDAGNVSGRNQELMQAIYEAVEKVGEMYGFTRQKIDYSDQDFQANLFVDYNTFFPVKNREEIIKKLYVEKARYGKIYYHEIPELGLTGGPRDFKTRVKAYKLDQIDFKGKKVIDIGCAGGNFVRYAYDRGASKAIGIDLKDTIHGAYIAANELGYWNTDYFERDLTKGMGGTADIVFYLSMNYHIETPDIVKNAKMVIFEDNGRETRENKELGSPWTDWFRKIDYVGQAKDHGIKSTYHLWK